MPYLIRFKRGPNIAEFIHHSSIPIDRVYARWNWGANPQDQLVEDVVARTQGDALAVRMALGDYSPRLFDLTDPNASLVHLHIAAEVVVFSAGIRWVRCKDAFVWGRLARGELSEAVDAAERALFQGPSGHWARRFGTRVKPVLCWQDGELGVRVIIPSVSTAGDTSYTSGSRSICSVADDPSYPPLPPVAGSVVGGIL